MVYLIGAGPGDPGLITYKGLQILKSCDAVIYDRLGTGELLDLVRSDCTKIYVGKQAGAHYKKQEEINRILVETAEKYENVVRLKGGDSFVFGRGGEEILTLQEADIPFQVIPGVTSAIAVPEVLGIPVTHREMSRSFHVITGHTKKGEADALANIHKQEGTSVFLMGLSNLEPIMQRLREEGESEETPVSVISNGMLPGETIVRGTVGTIGKLVLKNELVSPAIIVVGQTAACTMKDKNRSAIDGCKIGVVGTAVFREKLRGLLEEKGASLFSICDMHVRTCPDMEKLDVAIWNLSDYRWIVFTSQNGIRLFFDRVRACTVDLRKFADIRFAVVGSGCAQALEQYGFYADYIPEQYTTESLANGLCTVVKSGEKVLIPRAKEGSPVLEQILSANRIDAEILSIYDVRGARTENWKYLNNYDAILFASASGVHAFADCLAETRQTDWNPAQGKKRIVLGTIGQVTADTLGALTIYKEGEVLTGWNGSNFTYEVKKLPGATFKVTAGADIYKADGTKVYSKGDLIAKNLVTGSDGLVVLTDLHLGSYVVTETKSIDGYTINPTPVPVNIEYKDQNVEVQYESATIQNTRQKAEVSVVKKDSDTANPLDGGYTPVMISRTMQVRLSLPKVLHFRQSLQVRMVRQHTLWIYRLQTATIFLSHRLLMDM